MILLFSGTGNSLHVANLLAEHLGDTIVRLPVENNRLKGPDHGRIIWVFPVYSWGVPPVVRKWIKNLEISGGGRIVHHAVMTCGDDVGQADKMWRKDLGRRGWYTGAAFSVQMPNTYVLMKGFDVDSQTLADEKIKEAAPRVEGIARRIRELSEDAFRGRTVRESDVVRGGAAWAKTKIIYPWFVKFEMSPKPFHFTDACISCGKCAAICPMNNITMVSGHPCWGTDCALCLGCYHVCPAHAVAYGKATCNKGQKKILKD